MEARRYLFAIGGHAAYFYATQYKVFIFHIRQGILRLILS
jgi:hypothetical protein